MMERTALRGTLACIALLVAGCSSPSGPTDQPAGAAPDSSPAPAEMQTAAPAERPQAPIESLTEVPASPAAPIEETPATPAFLPSAPVTAAAPAPQPVTQARPSQTASVPAPTAPPVSAPAPTPAPTPAVADPGGPIAVAATKPGLSRVGSDRCDACHEDQFASWARSAHAARKPPLDCEGCHGPGSAYTSMAVMKDPAKARAAGLVVPERVFCSQCHVKGVTDDLMKRSHTGGDRPG